MADLPVIVLKEIFDFLSIQERLKLRSTCKTWKFVIDTFNSPRSLNIYSAHYPYKETWCFSDRVVVEDEMLYLDRYSSRRLSLKMEFFQNLQSLHLYYIYDKRVNHFLEELNSLSQLKVLMITKGAVHLNRLSLASLERFSFNYFPTGALELDTPNLNSLTYASSSDAINFRFPLKVKHLECISFTSSKLNQLKNLETLRCMGIISDFSLNNFKSLKRLEIWPHEEQLPLVRRIHEERKGLNRNLELIVSGLKEDLVKGVSNEFQATSLRLSRTYLEAIERNSSKFVGQVPWGLGIELEPLVEYGDRVPSKFFNGCCLLVERIQHSTVLDLLENRVPLSRLIELLRRSQTPVLRIGELQPSFSSDRVDLPAEFYHQIACLESLIYLEIEIRFENFDFDCLLKLKRLGTLRIHSESIPLTFLYKAVKQFKFFFQIECDLLNPSAHFGISITFSPSPEEDGRLPFLFGYGANFAVKKEFESVDEVLKGLKEIRESYLVSFPSLQPLLV